ncbi:hypothetical protein ElyMa_000495100 [Elysia marginata]|uniref:Uncharacterized protein n=1 Tax=Elysia marginata TaxID=1093978 RepID=A0AAV4FUU7_9GAST|nr:hypothetical protein ElyMa_000495100 [Elysia marginata]
MFAVMGTRPDGFALQTIFVVVWLSFLGSINTEENNNETLKLRPQLVFDGSNIMVFRNSTLKNFYKCLCNPTKTSCRYGYSYKSLPSPYFQVDKDPKIQKDPVNQHGAGSNTLVCHPGQFETERGKFSCIRSPDSFSWCDDEKFCQAYHVDMPFGSCDSKCVNIKWLSSSVGSRNFDTFPQFQSGSCDIGTSSLSPLSPQSTHSNNDLALRTSTSNSIITSDNPPAQTSSNSDSESLKLALAAGWILFALSIGLIVVYIIYRYRKSKSKSKKQNSIKSTFQSNAFSRNETTGPETGGRSDTSRPIPDAAKGSNNDYDYYSTYGREPSSYNIIDEARVKSGFAQDLPIESIVGTLAGYEEYKLPYYMSGERASDGKDRYWVLEQQGNAMDKPQVTGVFDAYNILGGRKYSPNRQIIDADLETYNQASGLPVEDPGRFTGDNAVSTRKSNLTDYDKLKNGGLGSAADVDMASPDTYNTGSTLFEERDKASPDTYNTGSTH